MGWVVGGAVPPVALLLLLLLAGVAGRVTGNCVIMTHAGPQIEGARVRARALKRATVPNAQRPPGVLHIWLTHTQAQAQARSSRTGCAGSMSVPRIVYDLPLLRTRRTRRTRRCNIVSVSVSVSVYPHTHAHERIVCCTRTLARVTGLLQLVGSCGTDSLSLGLASALSADGWSPRSRRTRTPDPNPNPMGGLRGGVRKLAACRCARGNDDAQQCGEMCGTFWGWGE